MAVVHPVNLYKLTILNTITSLYAIGLCQMNQGAVMVVFVFMSIVVMPART
jgi:hypothetical protein